MVGGYKQAFIEFALQQGVLKFGEFELKSGRISPYFFNAGEFKSGESLSRLGDYYAQALMASGIQIECLFGPAYKGIPLVCATAIAMANKHGFDIPYVFNRKEAKTHGEGGVLVGAPLKGNAVIIEDVITAGTAIREVMPFFAGPDVTLKGIAIAIDRQERGRGDLSAIQEVERDHGVPVISVVDLDDIVGYLTEVGSFEHELNEIGSYRAKYGIASA
jgi:orotate phosphoribosyltransferase